MKQIWASVRLFPDGIMNYAKPVPLKAVDPENYSSDEAKKIARLKCELHGTQDAFDVQKKAIRILWK